MDVLDVVLLLLMSAHHDYVSAVLKDNVSLLLSFPVIDFLDQYIALKAPLQHNDAHDRPTVSPAVDEGWLQRRN